MSLHQEFQGRALITNRRPPAASGIYLMQLRSLGTANTLPRRRLTISVELGSAQPAPHPVKINHVRTPFVPATDETAQPGRVTVAVEVPGVSQVQSPRG